MENEVKCDLCDLTFASVELFWRDADIDTTNQFNVSDYLFKKGKDVCCETCFDLILKEFNLVSKSKLENNVTI